MNMRHTLQAQAVTLAGLPEKLSKTYEPSLRLISQSSPVIFCGMGKSGFIAQKASATFRSMGKPAHYLHPSEASHGDLGMLSSDAVVVIISHSGNTLELADTILFCQEARIPIIAVTGNADSALAGAAEWTLCYGEVVEACPNGLAPTTSTLLALAICDCLAMDWASATEVTPADFRKNHPGGKLGQRLRTAGDLMKELPKVSASCPIPEAMLEMTGEVSGIVGVFVGPMFKGVLTDGDIRRTGALAFTQTAGDLMTTQSVTCHTSMRTDALIILMNEARITKILVERIGGGVLGVVNLHDCG